MTTRLKTSSWHKKGWERLEERQEAGSQGRRIKIMKTTKRKLRLNQDYSNWHKEGWERLEERQRESFRSAALQLGSNSNPWGDAEKHKYTQTHTKTNTHKQKTHKHNHKQTKTHINTNTRKHKHTQTHRDCLRRRSWDLSYIREIDPPPPHGA